METAEILINNGKLLQGLFFCHLAIEKILKALIQKKTLKIPPKSHNLKYLSELASIEITEEQNLIMAVLMKYQMEGRYPENNPVSPSTELANDQLKKTKGLFECIKKML